MKKLSSQKKIGIAILSTIIFVIAAVLITYLQILPKVVSNPKFIEFVQEKAKEYLNTDLTIKNPQLKTSFSPEISFKTDEILIIKEKKTLLSVKNIDTTFSIAKLANQELILKNFVINSVYADVNGLMTLLPKEEKPKEESPFKIDWLNSSLKINKCYIVYKPLNDALIKVSGKNLEITKERKPKRVHFDLNVNISRGKDVLNIKLKDQNNVFMQNKKLFIENFVLDVNNSKIHIKSDAEDNGKFRILFTSKNFDVQNIVKLLETNLVVPNGTEILSLFKDIKGNLDFEIYLDKKHLNGRIDLKKGYLKLVPVNNLPIHISQGTILLTENDITLKNIKGFYANKKTNELAMDGTVKDYTKTVKSDILLTGTATNDFAVNYLSKMVNFPIKFTAPTRMFAKINSIYDKIDIVWTFKLNKGVDILFDGASITPVDYDRALRAILHYENNNLNIKSVEYYIAKVLTKNSVVKPILTLNGNVDAVNGKIKDFGFNIPKPLPSEFFNLLLGQKFFKKGTISGELKYIDNGKTPYIKGDMTLKKVRIPSQRLSIKEGHLVTDNEHIHLKAFGRFKRANYTFDGNIKNSMVFPIDVKNINLTIDNLDIERVLKTLNNSSTTAAPVAQNSNDEDDDTYVFNPNLIIIEDCELKVIKGVYKDIKFGNLNAKLTLDKKGILQIQSNKFDFAEGISTLKVYCDLVKNKYSVRLGAKDVNSDLIASTILNLNKEISGKASALLEFYTDKNLKLNGKIQFLVKDGTITKLGLVEYALNFAALFRNPAVMISPSTLVDLVNVPDGTFNNIKGSLLIDNNIVKRINIKSSSPQLSSFVIGRINLENGDSALRIYTKFSNKNKGMSGILRNISLNSLANRIPLSRRNTENYYSAEISQLPPIEASERDSQIFLTTVDGDLQSNNFLSSLKKIK